jgi:hypothetical protein
MLFAFEILTLIARTVYGSYAGLTAPPPSAASPPNSAATPPPASHEEQPPPASLPPQGHDVAHPESASKVGQLYIIMYYLYTYSSVSTPEEP